MANANIPNGFTPVGTMSGGPWNGYVRAYLADGTDNDIFPGDMVVLQADGLVDAADAAETDLLGVCVGVLKAASANTTTYMLADQVLGNSGISLERTYYDASADGAAWILVAVGPDVLYEVQADGTTDLVDIGNNCEIVATAGDTDKGRSQQEISSTTVATAAQIRLISPAQRVDNDITADNSKWIVRISESHFTKIAGV